jgi:hypothetical protein
MKNCFQRCAVSTANERTKNILSIQYNGFLYGGLNLRHIHDEDNTITTNQQNIICYNSNRHFITSEIKAQSIPQSTLKPFR